MNAHTPRIGLRVLSNLNWMGGVNYVLNWARALDRLPAGERPEVLFLAADESAEDLARTHAELVSGIAPFANAGSLKLDFVFPATQIFEAPFGAPWAGWVPDWQCKHLPEMFDETERERRDAHYRLLATRAPLLVVSSQMALDDTQRLVGDAAVPVEKLHFPAVVDAAELAPWLEEEADVRRRFGLPERFLLVCNQFWKHKNHLVVFAALARIADRPVHCVFTGETRDDRWPGYMEQIRRFVQENGLQDRVHILGRVSRREQIALMRAAAAIVQPSRFEGWSTVVEEARALGKQLLLSSIPVHREQSPPGSRFFDPDDPDGLSDLMREVYDQAAERPALASNGAVAQEEFIEQCARRFLSVARSARARYDPQRHDPAVILAEFLPALAARADTVARKAVLDRALSGTRAMLSNQPERLAAFLASLYERNPDSVQGLEHSVVRPVLAELPPPARDRFHASANARGFARRINQSWTSRAIRRIWRRLSEVS